MSDIAQTQSDSIAEERLRLEREALAIERERLAAIRAHAEAERKLVASSRHPFLVTVSAVLLSALCFAAGMIAGMSISDSRQQRLREERLARALSHLDMIGAEVTVTNSASLPNGMRRRVPDDVHGNVSVMVIQ